MAMDSCDKAFILKTDNDDFPYCVQIHVSTDGGRNYFLRACRYFENEWWAKAFLEDLGYFKENEDGTFEPHGKGGFLSDG